MKASTELDYRRRIARVIEAIITQPGAPHTVESLAEIAHFSPYHFHRVYKSLTGETVAETIQRMRLAEAAHRLTNDPDSVTDVAADVGYESAQAFARAFRKFAGVSPGEFRSRQLHVTGSREVVSTFELSPLTALCLRHEGPTSTISQTYRLLLRLLGIDSASAKHYQTIGLCTGNPDDGDSFRYFAGIVCGEDQGPVGTLLPVKLEGGLYASQRLVGPYALIAPTFRALFNGWLPRSGYAADHRPALELYRDPPFSGLKRRSVTDVAIPIRQR